MGEQAIRNPETVREVLQRACERGELLILQTPYVRNDSTFLRLDQDAVHVVASLGREDAIAGLRSSQLRLRFPHEFTFLEGATELLGIGRINGRPSLKLAIPEMLADEDYRGAFRVDRVGRVTVTFSTRKYDILSGSLVNISTTGLRLHSGRDFEDLEMLADDTIMVTLTLDNEIHLNRRAKVRYIQGRSVGVEFKPVLEGELLTSMSRWVFRKREEIREREASKASCQHLLAQAASSAGNDQGLGGLVLVSSSTGLEERLWAQLTDTPFTRVDATAQSLRSLVRHKTLVMLHAPSLSLDDRRRLKALIEALGDAFPVLLLGTDIDNAELGTFGQELKVAATFALGPNPSTFFPRLVQGMLRKHFGESGA